MHLLKLTTSLAGIASAAAVPTSSSLEPDSFNSTIAPRAGPIYKVKDLTGPTLTGRFESGFTDLGIPALTPDGRLIFVCGDTFIDRVGGANWRSPIALFSSSTDLNNVVIDDSVGGASAVGLVPEGHAGGTTAIPSDVFVVGNKLYMNLMRGVIYQTHHSDFWVSSDNGQSWRYLFLWEGGMLNRAFQQKTCAVGDDNYAYCLSSIFNRDIVSDLLLHRVPLDRIEDAAAWQPWGYLNGAWAWGNPASTVAPARRWGEISWRNLGGNRWVFTWLSMEPLGIRYMVLNGPTGNMFTTPEGVLILPARDIPSEVGNYVASPYGGFIFPGSTVDRFDFAVSQWNGDTYRVMQFRADGL